MTDKAIEAKCGKCKKLLGAHAGIRAECLPIGNPHTFFEPEETTPPDTKTPEKCPGCGHAVHGRINAVYYCTAGNCDCSFSNSLALTKPHSEPSGPYLIKEDETHSMTYDTYLFGPGLEDPEATVNASWVCEDLKMVANIGYAQGVKKADEKWEALKKWVKAEHDLPPDERGIDSPLYLLEKMTELEGNHE